MEGELVAEVLLVTHRLQTQTRNPLQLEAERHVPTVTRYTTVPLPQTLQSYVKGMPWAWQLIDHLPL